MAQERTSRGVAMVVALGVQGLVLLALGVGLGIVPVTQPDAPALAIALIPELRPSADPPESTPKLHLQRPDPGVPPPVVPAELVVPEPEPVALPQPAMPRSTSNDSAGSVGSSSGIGIVSRVEPEYPPSAMLRRSQGTTTVAFLVDANGHPGAVRILHGSGDVQLDEAAVRAVQQWEFTAATSNSQVVPRWGRLEVNFDLTVAHEEHGGARQAQGDPVAVLSAALHHAHGTAVVSPAVQRLLREGGAVRSIRFVGVSTRLPDDVAAQDVAELRALDSGQLMGWNVFAVTQLHAVSEWYCAVNGAGQIQLIMARSN